LKTAVRQLLLTAGRTQASRVIAVVRSSDAESATVTQSLTPSKLRALPNLPVVQVAPLTVPPFPRPDPSAVPVPEPSSNPYPATRPVGGALVTVALASFEAGLMLPAASSAVTR
jgi:hypothetical protein